MDRTTPILLHEGRGQPHATPSPSASFRGTNKICFLANVHAIELRVDLLKSQNLEFIKDQIFHLRKHTCLPIIYTVRSQPQGGKSTATISQVAELLGTPSLPTTSTCPEKDSYPLPAIF